VTLAFALGGLIVAIVLAVITDGLTTTYLLRQRQDTATQQGFLNARLVRDALAAPQPDPTAVLAGLDLPAGTNVLLQHEGRWFGSGIATGPERLPERLRDAVADGTPARQRIDLLGDPALATGIPLPGANASYFEISSLDELERSLGIIRASLAGAAAATTLAAVLVGLWLGRRVLRPLGDVSRAAARIAGGDLATRLQPGSDPELAQLADAFNAMGDALQQRIERDARFVADVSHELRSPLTTLATAAQVLQGRRSELPERSRVALDLVVEEIDRFQHAVEELLELGRIDSGVETLELQPVALGEMLVQLTTRVDGGATEIELGPDVLRAPLLADKRRLERVLVNLLDNARTHGGGLAALRARRVGDQVRIEVDDHGPGIPEAERTHVFERFYRGAASGRRGNDRGTGLGLALVREHVAAHGGRVIVEDGPGGRGTRIVVELPWRDP
jgi:signal transduction histidine kinase